VLDHQKDDQKQKYMTGEKKKSMAKMKNAKEEKRSCL
jgi:hypothetical protein